MAEVQLLRASGYPGSAGDELISWNPSAADAQANCPSLDSTLRKLKELAGPFWRARVSNIYAGRTQSEQETALSAHGLKGGMAAISFRFTYALLAAVITWGDYLQFVDRVDEDPDVLEKAVPIKNGLRKAFGTLSEHGAGGLYESKLLTVRSHEHGLVAAQYQEMAEMWVMAHELAHHILRDGTSRPDGQARDLVNSYLESADLALELQGLSEEQLWEIRADVLALFLIAGEFVGDATATTELQAAMGALFGLLAVGLLRNDWLSRPDDSHPSTTTRLAVCARLAARRIMALDDFPKQLREEQVRAMATVLAYASWVSEVPLVVATEDAPEGLRLKVEVASASATLFTEDRRPMFAADGS